MVDLEVVGRHALLFDDDPMSAFVNSSDALVEWHSLLIDRYDVRHLLSSPPPPRKRRNPSPPSASSNEPELDHERYLDLPSASEQLQDDVPKPDAAGSYGAVGFSYGSTDYTNEEKSDVGQGDSSFRPSFTVPDILLRSLPPTEKLHQIIARTAMFVSKHGAQSEIVLRVKQGDNPTFGFLMPDHNLHPYFRFLVDHQELLQSEADGKPETEKKDPNNTNQTDSAGAGALSLLGSVYGNADDEDVPESKETVSEKGSDPSGAVVTRDSKESEAHGNGNPKDDIVAKHSSPPKQKTQLLKRTSSTTLFNGGTSRAKKSDPVGLLSSDARKPKPSLPSDTEKVEKLMVEPPSDLKSLVERLVEFIMRNGKQFETVLIEQDRTHGRFPFLLPSNIYHPYYLKVLQEAQESKLTTKDDSSVKKQDKKNSVLKENEGYAGCDVPFDSDRKEKFRMVLGKSKKDGQDQPYSASQLQFGVTVDADAAAAILQAATRGIRTPNFGIISRKLRSGNSNGGHSEGGQGSSLGSHHSNSQKSERKGDESVSFPVPVAKVIAKSAAIEAANEADSSEAHLSKEQKLKADRLKRAKMFVAMLKGGSTASKAESFRSLSVEPQEPAGAGSDSIAADKREGSVVHSDVGTMGERDKSDKKHSDDEFHERRSRRTYRSRLGKEEEYADEVEKEDNSVSEDEEKNHRHTKKKHRSHRSSRKEGEEEDRDRHRHGRRKHRSRRSSREGESKEERDHRHSRKRHRSSHKEGDDEEEEEDRHHRHSRRKHRSRHSSRSDKDRKTSRHGSKHEKSSDGECQRETDSSTRHRRKSRSEEDLEEGEISGKTVEESRGSVGAGVSREASVDLQSSYRASRAPSLSSGPTTEVSDDLRAKVRAMLMATR